MWRWMRSPAEDLRLAWRNAVHAARMVAGVPDYEAYVGHLRRAHPDALPPDRAAFFAERLQARYGRGRTRCC